MAYTFLPTKSVDQKAIGFKGYGLSDAWVTVVSILRMYIHKNLSNFHCAAA